MIVFVVSVLPLNLLVLLIRFYAPDVYLLSIVAGEDELFVVATVDVVLMAEYSVGDDNSVAFADNAVVDGDVHH